jgi:hypothetical protein
MCVGRLEINGCYLIFLYSRYIVEKLCLHRVAQYHPYPMQCSLCTTLDKYEKRLNERVYCILFPFTLQNGTAVVKKVLKQMQR